LSRGLASPPLPLKEASIPPLITNESRESETAEDHEDGDVFSICEEEKL
jgi:hypothetical protein